MSSTAADYTMDAAARELVRLCDAAIAAAEDELSALFRSQGPEGVIDGVGTTLRNLHYIKAHAQAGTLRRPADGAGLGFTRGVSELDVSDRLYEAARAVDVFYRHQM